jgi:glycosyltransferase involved in cell wall biosynthesis
LDILNYYKNIDDRIVIINNERNLKLPASLNKGIRIAKGEYIARMDADDIANPTRFEVQLNVLNKDNRFDFIGSLVECFYDDSNGSSVYANKDYMEDVHFNFISKSGDLFETSEMISRETYRTTRLCHSTLFGRRIAFEALMYREDVFAEDWDLYNRALNRGMRITKVPEVLIRYRIVNSGMCGQFNEQPHAEIRKKINKLNKGILYDCIITKSYERAFKFYWYHYLRYQIATIINMIKGILVKSIKRPVFNFMKYVYKNLTVKQLRNLFRVVNYISKNTICSKIPYFNRVIRLALLVLSNNKDVNPVYSEFLSSKPFYNIGVWTIEKKWAMGGLNTILKMIPALLEDGHKIRIINYGLHSEDMKIDFLNFLPKVIGSDIQIDSSNFEIVSSSTYRHRTAEFNVNDRFIAGFWEPAEDFINFRELAHFSNEKFVYIIQDYEPSMLYRWGSEYIRSKQTLEDGNYYPIYNNSEFVCGYLKNIGIINGWSDNQILRGEPCDTHPLPVSEMDGEHIKVVFYSRPTVDKNIYDIKIKALTLFISYIKDNFPEKYKSMEIVGIGESAPDVVHEEFVIKNLGKVDYSDYPKFLNKFNIGLSCIISPAFAYPCLEFPRAGLVTVVNRFENRDLEKYSCNIISCENSAKAIFEGLLAAIERIQNKEARFNGAIFSLPGVGIDAATKSMLAAVEVE